MDVFELADLQQRRISADKAYLEFVRKPSMSLGLFEIPADGIDGQTPHSEDEVYFVVKGRAKFVQEGEVVDVGPGTVLFVPAFKDHRFHTITEDISVLAFFAPPEHSLGSPE